MIKILKESHNIILIFIIPLILILIGFIVYKDYGISLDEEISRNNGLVSIKYICDFLFPQYSDNFELIKNVPDLKDYGVNKPYGTFFDILLITIIEVVLEIKDFSEIFYYRHLANHYLFIMSVICFYFLCLNVFKNKLYSLFEYLTVKCNIQSLKCTIVRDEGVYKTPSKKKEKIFKAYTWLTDNIQRLTKEKKINNYNLKSIQGKLHNKKDQISWELIKKMYIEPKYISPCHAGALFGIITASGLVYPCEILEDKLLGNLREKNMNFMKIWQSAITKDTKNFILKTNCNCTYECALTYNILGNWRYQPRLISSVFSS